MNWKDKEQINQTNSQEVHDNFEEATNIHKSVEKIFHRENYKAHTLKIWPL